VRANPNQYLLTGGDGRLVNRGSAVQKFLWPSTVFVLVPSTKQEAQFAFTQETRDGIPVRFKGIVIYRITDPVAAAQLFDFTAGQGTAQINDLLTHVALGELRHAVSHMTMVECIEQRKTTLSGVVQTALDATIHPENANDWGLTLEVAQLAQVFIVDADLRQQLEAEVRNEIKLKAEQSDIQTAEESKLTSMASEARVADSRLAAEQENLRRAEALRQSEMAAEEARINVEAPVRLLKIVRDSEVLREELAMHELRNQVRAYEVEHDQLLPRAQQELRREMLPLEQTPAIVESAARIFQGANLSIYGDDGPVLGQLGPLFEILARALQSSSAEVAQEEPASRSNG
jgi:regulator of protease activity HflC (stomatin/prohibitin superfamily)